MSRSEWVLGLVLAAILVVVAYFAITFWLGPDDVAVQTDVPETMVTRPAQVVPGPTAAFVERTALLAFGIAQQEMLTWSNDATLLSVKATFPYGNAVEDVTSGESNWVFSFVSASLNKIRTVSVVSGTVNVVGDRELEIAVSPAGIGFWRLDSDEVLELFMQEGGNDFLQQDSVATLNMALTTDNESGRVEWLVSLFGDQTGRSLTLRMDAGSGELLDRVGAP